MMNNGNNGGNPLLNNVSNFSLSDSFGPQPALLLPSSSSTTSLSSLGDPTHHQQLQEQDQTSPLSSSSEPRPPPPPPPSISSLGSFGGPPPSSTPTPPGLFLLPSSTSSLTTSSTKGPPPPPSTSIRPRYVPPPGMTSSSSTSSFLSGPPPPSSSSMGMGGFSGPSILDGESSSLMSPINNLSLSASPSSMGQGNVGSSYAPATFDISGSTSHSYPPQHHQQQSPKETLNADGVDGGFLRVSSYIDLCHHWFFVTDRKETDVDYYWKPFDMNDSANIESAFMNQSTDSIPVDGGRYDVDLNQRIKIPVYWTDTEAISIRRCSWFFQSPSSARWIPYSEERSLKLEQEYLNGINSRQWNRKIDLGDDGHIMLHSDSVMMHFPRKGISGLLDDWGQVQPQDPNNRPRMVHRGLDGLPDIPDGDSPEIDHLVFVIHGIGSACDIKFRTLTEVVGGFRDLTRDLSQKHFQSAHLSERVSRIEYLPVNWHSSLHKNAGGVDEKLSNLSLKSIPKLRNFMNDTLMDILFYTSPIYAQKIVTTVTSEINRLLGVFKQRNPTFQGQISLMGHSLGSLILFDILSHQDIIKNPSNDSEPNVEKTQMSKNFEKLEGDKEETLESLFSKIGIDTELVDVFKSEGIDIDSLETFSITDLIEAGLSEDCANKLYNYLKSSGKTDGFKDYKENSVESKCTYVVGPAGTGQPFVQYPQLNFKPAAFYALGSPIALFMSVRGIEELGENFKFPTCHKFFNIFHPFDPVAYRMEAMINKDYSKLRPWIIPHHMGRKRMHLELKDTVTRLMTSDFKKKILEGVSYTLSSVYNLATGTKEVEEAVQDELSKSDDNINQPSNQSHIDSSLNGGNRIDYVLQEAPLESFNEYLFALASHLCYWESEDTCLFILKNIYSGMNIECDDTSTMEVLSSPSSSAPPVTVASAYNLPPSSMQAQTTSTIAPPPPPPSMSSSGVHIGPPPPMMTPSITSFTTSNSSGSRIRASYPKPNVYANPGGFGGPPSGTTMGMDPTAPIGENRGHIGPPPITGFSLKK